MLESIQMQTIQKRLWPTFLLAVLVGSCLFGLLYGYEVLNPFRDGWILQGYDERDILQHYAGWCAFQTSPWEFPLGLADTMAYGTYISYTDSIPLVAIPTKLLLQLVGYTGTFQYFGLYTLLCYILQAFAAGLLVRRKSNQLVLQLLAMVLLCLTPVLLERAFRHTALGSQWLILFAIYTFLLGRDQGFRRYPWAFYLLGVLAILVHPYFIPLTMIFALITVFYGIRQTGRPGYFAAHFAGTLAACAAAGWAVGALNGTTGTTRDGFGFYSMNLNAIINPKSLGGYSWSALLKTRPQILGNYDGFNYLGVGVMLLAAGCFVAVVLQGRLLPLLREHWFYLLAMAGMTAFAVSNVVTLDDLQLFTLPLPEFLLHFCATFRASSRMFYAVTYSLLAFCLTLVSDAYARCRTMAGKNPRAGVLSGGILVAFAVTVAVQGYDLHDVFSEKHAQMEQRMTATSLLDDAYLQQRLQDYDVLAYDLDSITCDRRDLAICALKNGMTTLYSVASTTIDPYPRANAENEEKWGNLEKGITDSRTAYETSDEGMAYLLASLLPDTELYQAGDYYLFFPPQS